MYVRDPAKAADNNRRFEKRLRRAADSGMLDPALVGPRLAAVRFTAALDDLADSDLVIETIVEDFAVKIELFHQLEALVAPGAILTTNTSSLSINRIADCLARPERFCGYHYFHPIQLTTLVEIVTARHTSAAVIPALREISRLTGRRPVVVKDEGGGSAVNVPLACLTMESLYVLKAGLAGPAEIDKVACDIARVGPCEGLDVLGIAFFIGIMERIIGPFALGYAVPEVCRKLLRDGRDGRYTGDGVFLYKDDRPVDDRRDYYLVPGQTHTPPGARSTYEGLFERLLFCLYYAMLKLARQGFVSLEDICFACFDVMMLKLDPLAHMQSLGAERLRETFRRLAAELGPRFDPAAIRALALLAAAPAASQAEGTGQGPGNGTAP